MRKYAIGALSGAVVGFFLPWWLTFIVVVGGALWLIKTMEAR